MLTNIEQLAMASMGGWGSGVGVGEKLLGVVRYANAGVRVMKTSDIFPHSSC